LSFIFGVASSDITLVLISNVFTELFNRLLKFERIIGMGGSVLLIIIGVYFLFFKKVKLADDGISPHHHLKTSDYIKIYFAGYFICAVWVIFRFFRFYQPKASFLKLLLTAVCLSLLANYASDLIWYLLYKSFPPTA